MRYEVRFESPRPAGAVELRGLLALPDRCAGGRGLVLCHPHPAGGGSMDVGLLETMESRAARAGFAVLRFDFGGVGRSSGAFTDGLEEPCDVAAACGFVRGLGEVDPSRVALAGWSFGAWMALLAVGEGLEAACCVAVAPPLALCDWRAAAPAIAASAVERHYIAGADDRLCTLESLRAFTGALGGRDSANTMVLPSTDHFLAGREEMVSELTVEFVQASSRVPGASSADGGGSRTVEGGQSAS